MPCWACPGTGQMMKWVLPRKGTSPLDGQEKVIELHAVHGFKHPIVNDLETVDR